MTGIHNDLFPVYLLCKSVMQYNNGIISGNDEIISLDNEVITV